MLSGSIVLAGCQIHYSGKCCQALQMALFRARHGLSQEFVAPGFLSARPTGPCSGGSFTLETYSLTRITRNIPAK